MLRPIVFLLTFSVMVACQNSPQSEGDQQPSQGSELNEDPNRNSEVIFKYPGVYAGEIPCENCEAIRIKIKLAENGQYFRARKYLGQTKPNLFEEEGPFDWDEETQKIVLNGAEEPNQYVLQRTELQQLGVDGEELSGELAEKYILRKR